MSPLRRIVVPLAAVLIMGAAALIFVLALSGGNSDGLSDDDQAYVADVCGAFGAFALQAQPALNQVGDPANATGIEDGLDDLSESLTAFASALGEIEPPGDVEDAHEQTVTQVEGLAETFSDVADALRAGDVAQLEAIGDAAGDLEGLFPSADDYPPEYAEALAAESNCQAAEGFFGIDEGEDDPYAGARAEEAYSGPDLPGEWVDLASIYGGPFGPDDPNTNSHVLRDIDYAGEQGLPPVGGPHWGSSGCPDDPTEAPPFCGPAPWGIYDQPWGAATLVHNMEHGGVVVWYNTADLAIIDQLEDWARQNSDRFLVVAPFPELPPETIAITSWSRRDVFPAAPLDGARLQTFLEAHECRFDPEGLCGDG